MSKELNDDTVAEKEFATSVQTANELAEERDNIILSDESGVPFIFSDDIFSSDPCVEQEVHCTKRVTNRLATSHTLHRRRR